MRCESESRRRSKREVFDIPMNVQQKAAKTREMKIELFN